MASCAVSTAGATASPQPTTRNPRMSESNAPERWRIHGERSLYDTRWVRLTLVDVEPPGGERFEHHVVRLFRVAIAAILDDQDRVLMIWRYRFLPDRFGWELPGGIVEEGAGAAEAAARETEGETRWGARTPPRPPLRFQTSGGMGDSPPEL